MKQFKSILLGISLFLLHSCNLLDVDTVSSITGDGYWNTKGDVESYMIGIYTKLRDTSNSTLHFEDRGDAFTTGLEGGPSNLWAQNLTSQNGYSWSSYYSVIQHCNMLLKYTPGIDFGVEADKNRLLAEAYCIRGYMYFCIARIWGDAPLELEPTESSNKPKLAREPAEEVLACALSDVNTAINLFPEESYANGKGRASKPACYALKADILLWKAKVMNGSEQDLKDVITYADLASKGLSLEDNFADIYGTKYGKEVIWTIHFEIYEKEAQYSQSLKPRDVFVEKAVNKDEIPYAKGGARSTYAPSPFLIGLFNANPADIRTKDSYITAKDADGNEIGTFDNKMKGTKTEGDRTYDSDIVIYRLAEMYLFKAEAYAALNQTPQAIIELNRVRDRAKIGTYNGSTNKIAVEKEILNERARELYLERKRWPDLLRFHYGGTIDVYQEVPNLRKKVDDNIIIPLYLAIPLSDININPNLKQTQGYENL